MGKKATLKNFSLKKGEEICDKKRRKVRKDHKVGLKSK